MRLLADLHISPTTVQFLRELGHDIIRVTDALPPTASDQIILAKAAEVGRTVLTQDLDFSHLIALSGSTTPSLITLRLSSARVVGLAGGRNERSGHTRGRPTLHGAPAPTGAFSRGVSAPPPWPSGI